MLCVSVILLIVRGIYSYGVMLIKKLKESTSLEIMYFQNMVLLFATAILLPVGLKDENFYKPDAMDLLQLALFTCIPLSLGQLAVNQALLMTKNYGLVTPFMFSSIIAGYIISIVRYGEEANIICLAGNVGIIVGVTLLLRSKAGWVQKWFYYLWIIIIVIFSLNPINIVGQSRYHNQKDLVLPNFGLFQYFMK